MDTAAHFLCGEETDPRLTVELWKPSPYLPANSPCFDGMYFDERGLVFKFSDGSYLTPKTYEMQVVFSGAFESMRMNALSVYEDDRIFSLAEKAGLKRMIGRAFGPFAVNILISSTGAWKSSSTTVFWIGMPTTTSWWRTIPSQRCSALSHHGSFLTATGWISRRALVNGPRSVISCTTTGLARTDEEAKA